MRARVAAAILALVASLTAAALVLTPLLPRTGTAQPVPGMQLQHAWYRSDGSRGADLLGQGPLSNEEEQGIALRGNGSPCVTFVTDSDTQQPDVLLGCYDGSSWHGLVSPTGYDQLTSTPTPSELPEVEVAYDGTVFVAWSENLVTGGTQHEIRLAFFDGSSWTGYQHSGYDVVSAGVGASNSFDLAVNPITGMPAITWANQATTKIHYREWNGQTWTGRTGSVDTLNTTSDLTVNAIEPALAIGSDGVPNVTWTNYIASGAGEVLFRHWSGSWRGYTSQGSDNLTHSPTTSEHLSQLATLPDGRPAVVWEDAVAPDGQVHYVEWSGSAWRGRSGQAPDLLSQSGGAAPSLAVSTAGVPVVLFRQFDGATYKLLATRWTGTTWGGLAGGSQPEAVDVGDTTVNQGLRPVVAIDTQGRPHAAWTYRAGGPYNSLNLAYSRWR